MLERANQKEYNTSRSRPDRRKERRGERERKHTQTQNRLQMTLKARFFSIFLFSLFFLYYILLFCVSFRTFISALPLPFYRWLCLYSVHVHFSWCSNNFQ